MDIPCARCSQRLTDFHRKSIFFKSDFRIHMDVLGASYKDYHRDNCRSNQIEPFDLEVHKHELWALWRAQRALRAWKWSCTHVAHAKKLKKLLFFATHWFLYTYMHTYFAFKIIKMPKFYFFRNLRKILSQIRVLNVKIGWVFTALVCFKKGEKIAKNASNGCFLPFNTCTVMEVPHNIRSYVWSILTHVIDEIFFIRIWGHHRKFCKYLKFSNIISTTNEIYEMMYIKDIWTFIQKDSNIHFVREIRSTFLESNLL